MRQPWAQAFICAGIAFVLFLAGLLTAYGGPGPQAVEAIVRLLLSVTVPALITGFWASRSQKPWPFWRIAITFIVFLFVVLALQAVGARSRAGAAEQVQQPARSSWGPVSHARAAEQKEGSPVPEEIRIAIGNYLVPNIAKCWRRPDEVSDEHPKIKIQLDKDGKLLNKPTVVNSSDDPLFAPYAESAIRAIQRCAPYDGLARYRDFHDYWREMVIPFRAQQVTATRETKPAAADRKSAARQKNYSLTVDGAEVGIEPGETVELTTPDGRTLTISLERREFVTHTGEFFSFEHPGQLVSGTADLGNGVLQHGLVSAMGTLVVVQEYRELDPSSLTGAVLQEMTKEAAQAGATITQRPTTRRLESGTVLKGTIAQVKSQSETIDIEVVAVGTGDRGVVVLTHIDQNNSEVDGTMIERFWESLRIGL